MEQSEMDIRNSSNSRIRQDAGQIYNFLAEREPLPEHADFILAAGTYDLRVADHAARLFLDGYAPLIVCSGGFGKLTSQLFRQPFDLRGLAGAVQPFKDDQLSFLHGSTPFPSFLNII